LKAQAPSPSVVKKRDYISFSAISTFQACPLRYYFRYVAGLPEEVIAASQVFGSCMHAAVQCHFEQMLAGQPAPDLDGLLYVFQDAWRQYEGKKVIFPKAENADSFGRLAERMLRSFLNTDFAFPKGQIIGVEEELRGVLIPGLPDLLARLDLIVATEKALVITDFKTAARSWGDMQVLDASPQLLLYGEIARGLADGKPIELRFAVFTKAKQPRFEMHPVRFDSSSLGRTKRVVQRIWQAIQSGHFYPSPSPLQCPSCPFRAPCAAWRG
jgi:CRISPR/Cas system-associated exonuclease Cas4 (RecB family)